MNEYRFSSDFSYSPDGGYSGAKKNIESLVKTYGIPNTYVEVGIFEGGTLFWVADSLTPVNPNFKVYGVDPHVGSSDMSEDPEFVKANFLHNLSQTPSAANIEYVNLHSNRGLIELINRGVKAEIIYVDGDHRASGVLTDLILAWELLVVGGVMLCDDATFWKFTNKDGVSSAQDSPRMAIENFIQCFWHKIEIIPIPDSWQTAFKKLEE